MPARINLSVKRSGIRLLLGVMLLSSMITGFAAEAPLLRFSAIPDQDETRLQERFSLVADYLSRRLSVPVEYVPVKDYAARSSRFATIRCSSRGSVACPACRRGGWCRARKPSRRGSRTRTSAAISSRMSVRD